MSSNGDLDQWLQSWRQLTLNERVAIDASDWKKVAAIQQEKEGLKSTLETSRSPDDGGPPAQPPIGLIEELLEMEEDNRRRVAIESARVRTAIQGLDRSAKSLQDLQRTYIRSGASHWSSYS